MQHEAYIVDADSRWLRTIPVSPLDILAARAERTRHDEHDMNKHDDYFFLDRLR